MKTFREELEILINRHSQENGSDTPDFVLARYLLDCLLAFNVAVNHREKFYGREHWTAPQNRQEAWAGETAA